MSNFSEHIRRSVPGASQVQVERTGGGFVRVLRGRVAPSGRLVFDHTDKREAEVVAHQHDQGKGETTVETDGEPT